MVVKVIIKDTTITLNEILIWIKKRFFWNLFQSWFIMRNRFSKMSEKLSDNRPEPPGLDNHHASHISFKKDAVWKWCSLKLDLKCKCIPIHSKAFKIIQNHSKLAARSKRIIFLDHAPFYGNYKKQKKTFFHLLADTSLNLLHVSLNNFNLFCQIKILFELNYFCFI